MKKKRKYFILIFITLILVSIFIFISINQYHKQLEEDISCRGFMKIPMFDTPFISSKQKEEEFKKAASEYGLNFEAAAKQDTLTNYFLRSPKFMIDENSFRSAFYNIYVKKYLFTPDYIDKEHKLAVFFERDLDYIFTYYEKLEESPPKNISANDTYFQELINNVKPSQEVKKPFQKENIYTVIYVELNLCNEYHYYGDNEGLLIPYLEKAFESLGYTKKEETE